MADARERYVFIKKLAEGGMADVFLARDLGQSPPRLCVVKQLLPDLRSKKEHVSMFLDEADLAMRLAHPNVVRALDRGSGREGPFLVLEYLAGYDLDLVVERLVRKGGRFPWQLVVHVIIAAAEGMAYAHALTGADGRPMNLVHRDLTPSNLFITFDGVVKVLDFGIARADERRTRTSTGMLKGKARYLAPELIEQKPADGRVDQFSLGAALYEALAARPLFTGDNELAVIHAIIESRRPSLLDSRPDVPSAVDAVFRRMTSRSRDDRFPNMTEVSAALRAVLPRDDHRLPLSAFLREHFGSEFEAHAALMARLASASTAELRGSFERGTSLTPLPAARLDKTVVGKERTPAPVAARDFDGDDPTVLGAPLEVMGLRAPVPVLPVQAEPRESPLTLPPDEVVATLPALDLRPPRRASSPSRPPSSPPLPDPPNTARWLLAVGVIAAAAIVAFLWNRSANRVDAIPRGALLVRSQPPGASIKVNGSLVPFRTPAALPDLQPGVYEVVLEHRDGLPTRVTAQVVSGVQRTVDVTLPPREALVALRVSPPEAVVSLDDVPVELVAGTATVGPLTAGTHELRVAAIGYRTSVTTFTVTDGARQDLSVVLEVESASQLVRP